MAARYNISIDEGSDFALPLKILDGQGSPMDLTGYTLSSHIRREHTDTVPTTEFTCTIDSPPTSGSLSLSLSSDNSVGLSGCYVYDLEATTGSATVRLLQGKVTISPEVTK